MNFTDNSRVHLYAQQFLPNCSTSLREKMDQRTNISTTTFPFAKWKNMYESNVAIGDEIRYVFDR
jgi:hypothetical protein